MKIVSKTFIVLLALGFGSNIFAFKYVYVKNATNVPVKVKVVRSGAKDRTMTVKASSTGKIKRGGACIPTITFYDNNTNKQIKSFDLTKHGLYKRGDCSGSFYYTVEGSDSNLVVTDGKSRYEKTKVSGSTATTTIDDNSQD